MERIEGPMDNGYYLAAYACPSGASGGYVAYAKVCRARPASYWEADCVLKDGIGLGMRTMEQAMEAVMGLAKQQVRSLPPQGELPAAYRRQPIPSHARSALGLWGA
jgi:hypothetical protein